MTSPIEPTKRCPFCAELVLAAAIRCKHCQADLSVGARPPSAARGKAAPSEFTGIAALAFPLVSTGALWLWVGQMNLLQDPSSALVGVSVVTVIITAFLVLAEAHAVGAGSEHDLDEGVRRHGPVPWFFATLLVWVYAFPAWFHRRQVYGLRNLLAPAILSMAAFLGSSVMLGVAIDSHVSRVKASFANIGTKLGQPSEAADTARIEARYEAASAKYIDDRDRLRRAKPKTEDDVVRVLGRKPDNVVESAGFTLLQWLYDTSAMNRDVIQVTMQGGRITLMNL